MTEATEYDAVVYDLDGTVVSLDVDWAVVRDDVAAALSEYGLAIGDEDLWGLLELSDREGRRDVVEEVIAGYECPGARDSERLPTADDLVAAAEEVPVGVCSLNCERACRIALDVHGLADLVDAVVGRDSVEGEKPDPEPLLASARALSASPERTLFVGDSERDRVAAERAGIAFRYVDARRA